MTSKQIDVTCPCCSIRLTIDVLTGQVLRHSAAQGSAAESTGDRWASAHDRVRERTKSGEGKLENALEHERGKAARFDELFKKAREKHARGDDEEPRG